MCGIIAYLSKNHSAIQYLLEGLTILQNRGYDSAGVATITSENKIINTKFASETKKLALESLKLNSDIHKNNNIGIAHTRWATHGAKTDYNAHPHQDYQNRLALVHNGIIENYSEIKQFLQNKNIPFQSDTDTEVVSNLISYYLDHKHNTNHDIMTAIEKAFGRLEGTWGIAMIFAQDPDHLYLCKKGSPLLLAFNDNFVMVASESTAFSKYTKQYIALKDNEIVKIGLHNRPIFDEFHQIQHQAIQLTPDPYPHWMLKEIFEQKETALRAINMGGRIQDDYHIRLGGLQNSKNTLLQIHNLLILACGTSKHSALIGARFFRQLQCFNTVQVIDAAEFIFDDIPKNNPGILVISQSGETKDVHEALELAKNHNITVIGIVNVVGSLIARDSDCGIYLNAGREVSVASTKAFTSQVIVLSLMALWFSQIRNDDLRVKRFHMIRDIHNLSINIEKLLEFIHNNSLFSNTLIDNLKLHQHMFILGKNLGEPIAYEGALKIKEVSYIHAEGFPSGSLKHGPFALIDHNTPIILLAFDDEEFNKIHVAAEEVKARGAFVILITCLQIHDCQKHVYHEIIKIEDNGKLTCLLGMIVLQYLAYKLSTENGINPDYPKNLAKCCATN